MNQPILDVAIDIEQQARIITLRGYGTHAIATALLINIIRDVDYEDVKMLAEGDEELFGLFIERNDLGNFIYEHTSDIFQTVAEMELDEREKASEESWESALDLRQMQGDMPGFSGTIKSLSALSIKKGTN